LSRQDTALWSRDRIIEAEGLLTSASAQGRFGRYQCEAAIQSVHVQRGVTGRTNDRALLALYDLLISRTPSSGALVSRAAVLARLGDSEAALAALDTLPEALVAGYQPYWVTRADVLRRLQHPEAAAARQRALDLTELQSLKDFLEAEPLE
jgi:RNA polymerase sigma-70 factor (ECF subfamily)